MELRNDNQAETLSADDEAVRALVGSLKHVEAPANFERRVMTAIESRPAARRPFAFAFAAFALPALVVVLIATFFIFRSARQQPVVDQPAIAQKDVQPAPLPTAAATMVPAAIDPTLAAESSPLIETQPASTQPPSTQSKRNAVRTADVNAQPGGGSFDETLRQTRRPLPQGISIPNSPNAANPDEVMTHIDIPVREVLGQIGINADRSGGWRVKSVTPNSQAAHSGIQAGDVVLSLGDHDISARDNFESGGSVSSIKLRRGGKVITLPLKN